MVVIAIIAILAALLLPALAKAKRTAQRASCVSNMKQVSLAFILWVHDHEANNLPFRVLASQEGTKDPPTTAPWYGLQNENWFQFSWVSNQLDSPKVLVCASDKKKHVADSWAFSVNGGFLHSNQRGNSVSYNLWLDAGFIDNQLSFENAQEHILISDRNVIYDNIVDYCSAGIRPAREVDGKNPNTIAKWDNQKEYGHGVAGQVGLLDGSVASVNTSGLKPLIRRGDWTGDIHFISPQ